MSEKRKKNTKKNIYVSDKEYYRRAGFDFDVTDYDTLAHEWTDYYRSRADLELFDGAEKTLKTLANRGLKQIIISASEKKHAFEQTKVLGIDGLIFPRCSGLTTFMRAQKGNSKRLEKKTPESKSDIYRRHNTRQRRGGRDRRGLSSYPERTPDKRNLKKRERRSAKT